MSAEPAAFAHSEEAPPAADAPAPEQERDRPELLRALAEAQRESREAKAVACLSAAMLASETVEKLSYALLEIFVQLSGSDVAVLVLREGEQMRNVASRGLELAELSELTLSVSDCLPREAQLQKGVPVFAAAGLDDPGLGAWIGQLGVRSLHCVPLLSVRELAGVVYLGAKSPRVFSEEEKQLLFLLAEGSAAALLQRTHHDELQQAIHANRDVLGVVAHDLRNPLNVIGMAANILLSRLPDSTARRPVERILRGVERANHLVQDLLAINAIEGGRFAIEKRLVETADTILASLESQQTLVASASIIIATDLSPGLPAIEMDEERILEVLENLVGNAIKFTAPGGTVTVGASAGEKEILFWVKDSGCGIAAADLPHLFDRFWQARKKDRRGTGLGLTICKAIVEAHGGRMWAESALGKGTTIFFAIPSVAGAPKSESFQVANILLVDDRLENLISLEAILDRPEYRLVMATSGEEALKLALRENFSVAIIDIAMPGMNGLEVATHMKNLERSRDIPIIFVTAFGDDPEEIHRAYSAGGADYLVKPLDTQIVRKKVAVFVDLSLRRQAVGRAEKLSNP